MTTRNQIGQTGYSQFMDVADEGQPHMDLKAKAVDNPLSAQSSVITVGGTASDGVYSIAITDDQTGELLGTASFDRQSSESSDTISDELLDAVNALASAPGRFSASDSGSAELTIAFEHTDKSYSLALTAPGSGTLTAVTAAAGGTDIPFGRFVEFSGETGAALPSAAAAADIVGVSVREFQFFNQGSRLNDATDVIPPGSTFAAGFEGKIAMRNNGSVASARGGLVYVVINTAGGDELGEARSDDDGANSIPLDRRAAYWDDVVQPGEVGWVYVRL